MIYHPHYDQNDPQLGEESNQLVASPKSGDAAGFLITVKWLSWGWRRLLGWLWRWFAAQEMLWISREGRESRGRRRSGARWVSSSWLPSRFLLGDILDFLQLFLDFSVSFGIKRTIQSLHRCVGHTARRTKSSRPEGPLPRSRAPEWPLDFSISIGHHHEISSFGAKTSQELRMLSSVTINWQVTKIVMTSGSQLSEL